MGDSPERTFPIYLPPKYSNSKSNSPCLVFFMLAGFSGKGAGYLTDDSAFGTPLQNRLDQAINEGRLPPSIVVFPDCTSKLGCSQYLNSPAFGNYMDYLCDELVPLIDSKYHTYASPNQRGLAGHSSGGFGALITGMLRPDVFKYICSSAGDSFFEVSLLPQLRIVLDEIHKAGSIEALLKKFFEIPSARLIPGSLFEAILNLQLASCYAPNLKNPPLFGDLFYNLENGKIIPEIWAKYLAWDPIHMVDRYEKNLRTLQFILLEAGAQDEHGLHWGHRQIGEKLKRLAVPYALNEYPGGHGGHNWRFESRLVRLAQEMQKP